jgi:hypothetical protein
VSLKRYFPNIWEIYLHNKRRGAKEPDHWGAAHLLYFSKMPGLAEALQSMKDQQKCRIHE